MIGKSHSGSGFGGLTRYLLYGKKADPKPDRVEWTSTRELALEDPREAALLMRMTAAQGRTDEPVHHLSISLAPGEHLSPEQWEKVVDRTLEDLGLEGHQVLVVAHRDTDHEHIHLMVNRVHPETFRAWDRWQDRPRLMASLRVREREFGLQFTPHVHNPDRLPDRLMQAFIHTGEPPFLDYARAEARPIFMEAGSWAELHERLAEKGLYLERKGQGLVVTDDHRHVKASSVDRGASLPALESRLGPYEERRPLLPEVDSDLRGDRHDQLLVQVEPALRASQEAYSAQTSIEDAVRRLKTAGNYIRTAIQDAFRDPDPVEARYLAHLVQQRSVPPLRPSELGELKGHVLRAGRTPIVLGERGGKALEIATGELPRFAAAFLRAQDDIANAEARLAEARQKEARLSESFRPQFVELDEIRNRSANLHERLLSMRPRDQLALARRHGRGELEQAAQRRPEHAIRTLDSRQRWVQNPSRDVGRVLDRRLSRTGLSLPTERQSLIEWTRQAFRLGMHPLHAVQVLTRGGVPLADAARAVSLARAAVRNPAKTALWFTARALGLPSLPVRMATAVWDLVRGQVLSR